MKKFKEAIKSFVFKNTNFGRPHYPYSVEPIQLATLINELERLIGISGNVVEIGVPRGMTTQFVCELIVRQNPDPEFKYFALDTLIICSRGFGVRG